MALGSNESGFSHVSARPSTPAIFSSEEQQIDPQLAAWQDTVIRMLVSTRFVSLRRHLTAIRDADDQQLTENNMHLLVIEADSFHTLLSQNRRPCWHFDCPTTPIRDKSWIDIAQAMLETHEQTARLFEPSEELSLTAQAIALYRCRFTETIDAAAARELAADPKYAAQFEEIFQ